MSKSNMLARWFSRNAKRPSFIPTEHTNYNFEQNPEYGQKYKRALVQKELMIKKLEAGTVAPKMRKRIVKDINYSIENYQAWRRFDIQVDLGGGPGSFIFNISGSFKAKPRDVVRAFGFPNQVSAIHQFSAAVFFFEDRNLDFFQLFDYNRNIPKLLEEKTYDDVLDEFLVSEEEIEFRFSGSQYCERHRFKKYLLERLANVISGKEKSYDEIAQAKFGKLELFNEFEKDYKLDKEPALFKYSRGQFEKAHKTKLTFIDDANFDVPIVPAKDIRKDEGTKKM